MRYTNSHEWILVEGKIGVVGITDHAQKELGEIVYVELPKVGSSIQAGDEVSVLESTKAAADVYAPVTGKIVKVNSALNQNPSLLNQDPEENGWLFEIELENKNELEALLSFADYQALIS